MIWDFLKSVPVHFWPWILFAGMVGFFFVAILVTCMLEKHHVRQFVQVGITDLPPSSPYFQAMNDAAPALGYQHCGWFVQSRDSSLYKCCVSLWISAEQNSLLVIGGGKLAKIDFKRTYLVSRTDEEKTIVTVDDFGLSDLGRTRGIEVLFNADLPELHELHLGRVTSLPAPPLTFSPASCFDDFEAMERKRAEKLIALGLANWIDSGREIWRYTVRGAWAYAYDNYLTGMNKAQSQKSRLNKKRPGS